MKVNCILTYDVGNQEFLDISIPKMWPTKQLAIDFFKKLVKRNHRHLEANGKLWCDDLGTVEHNPYWRIN